MLFQAVLTSCKSDRESFSIGDWYVTQYETPKGIQVPGSISFKNSLKEAWRIASSIFKMEVKFSYEKYTCSGENGSPTLSVWCEQLSIFKWKTLSRGSTATLTILWRNPWPNTGQTHEKLTLIWIHNWFRDNIVKVVCGSIQTPRGSTATLTIFWRNSGLIAGQTHTWKTGVKLLSCLE